MRKALYNLPYLIFHKSRLVYVLLLFCCIPISQAQVQYFENPTNQELIQAFQGENILIENPTLTSGNRENQVAIFQNGIEGASLEIEEGVYFSTGNLNIELTNINSNNNSSISNGITYEDEDLLIIEENAKHDVVLFEFDIQLSEFSDTLLFTYQFGSEEYPDFVGSIFNDVFAIFIDGPGFSAPTNASLIPTSGNAIAVNTVNGGVLGFSSNDGVEVDLTQTDFYINNGHLNTGEQNPVNQPGPFLVFVEFNGITTAITSEVENLIPGETYHIKIALADTADPIYDSGVFFNAISANIMDPEITFLKDGFYLGEENRAAPEDEVLYVFDIINEGVVSISDIEFEDEFFQDVEIEGLADVVLAPGESFSFELNYLINQQEINEGALYNQAKIKYNVGEDEYEKKSVDPTPLAEDHPFFDSNCPDCTVVLLPQQPEISLIKTAQVVQESLNIEVGTQVNYFFTVKNTGNVDLFSVQIFDELPGIELEGNPIDLLVGEESENHFTATYFVSPSDFAQRRVENQATVAGITLLEEEVIDLSDFELFTEDRPTVIEIPPCEIKIYNTITPNGDQVNDEFYIEGIECFPDNEVQIFNRWGVEVYRRKGYNNADVSFDGTSDARATLSSSKGLPTGAYYYVLQFTNDENEKVVKKGTLYIKQED